MADIKSIERLESRLKQLIEGTLAQKKEQIAYLRALNRIDDLVIDFDHGDSITSDVTVFLNDYRDMLKKKSLSDSQQKRLGEFLSELMQRIRQREDGDSQKLADEIRQWLRDLGGGGFRITLKRPAEQVSLAGQFQSLLRRETVEFEALFAQREHLLSCLDDALKSAETKTDKIYRHLAAAMIFFLQEEGYKVEPYLERLRRLRVET
jgi:hypothetical protein